MKKLLSFAFILCCAAIAAAQERVIDKTEFDSLVASGTSHRAIWKDEKYRMTITTSSKAGGPSGTDWSSKIIIEYGSTTETRSFSSSVFNSNARPTNESLRVGEWVYSRTGDGPWTKKKFETAAQKEREPSPMELIGATTEYKYLGPGTFRDVPVQIYVKTERTTKVGKTTGQNMETDAKVTYWIDSNGTVLKSEYSSENRGASVTSRTLITTVWERDPSIKFTPPEIVS
ncbi:MAG TPA: hypothetical protein VJV05_05335 [Pyrinomonadaceae bacterium]|nr:hypothetical protein [Pyrinomonadaceae bacterium]